MVDYMAMRRRYFTKVEYLRYGQRVAELMTKMDTRHTYQSDGREWKCRCGKRLSNFTNIYELGVRIENELAAILGSRS